MCDDTKSSPTSVKYMTYFISKKRANGKLFILQLKLLITLTEKQFTLPYCAI
jgi:hypothetical protein